MNMLLKRLGGIGTGVLNTLFSVFNAGFNGAISLMKTAMNGALQYHKEGISFARGMGMSLKEAQAYTAVLTRRASDLGFKYGIAADKVLELQQNIASSTSKALMLNDAEAERMIQINKLVGSNVSNEFVSQMMNGMGAQLSTVQGAVSKAYSTAAKSGLNAAQFSEKVAKNLSMANRLSFRDGVNGVIRMVALSEKLGINMQTVESAANNFMELDKAIENSARLQMLGGNAAIAGGNPLAMSYEANYDPEAFAKRMSDTLGSYATFDTKTGMANVNGLNRDFVKNIANAMGISMEDAMQMAKKRAEVDYKKNAYGSTLGRYSQEQQDFILNKSYVDTKTGDLMMNDVNGNAVNISRGGLSSELIAEMQKFEGMSDKEIMANQAQSLTSIDEKLKGLETSSVAEIAKNVNDHIPGMSTFIQNTGQSILTQLQNLAPEIGKQIKDIVDFLNNNQSLINEAIGKIGGVLGFILNNLNIFLGLYMGKKILGWLINGPFGKGFGAFKSFFDKGRSGATRFANAAKGTAKGVKWLGGKALKGGKWLVGNVAKSQVKWMKMNWNALKGGTNFGKSLITKGASAAYNTVKNGSTKLWNSQKGYNSTVKSAWKEAKNINSNASRSWKNTLNKGGSRPKAVKNVLSNIIKNTKSAFSLKSLGGNVLKAGAGGIAGMAINAGTDYLVNSGKIKKGGVAHYGGKMLGTAAEYAAIGSMLGPIGTGIGAAVGGIKGAYDTWKSLPENADKNFIDYAKSVGEGIVNGGKSAFDWAKEHIGGALSSFNKEIQERGGYLKVAFNYITTPLRVAIDGITALFTHPIDALKKIWISFTNWMNGDDMLGKLMRKAANLFLGEKKENGGVVGEGAKTIIEKHDDGGIVGGTSYTGDKIVTGLNSREMVLNADQQNGLFNFIKNLPNEVSNTYIRNNSLSSSITSYGTMPIPPTQITAKPVGEKEYIYTPNRTETSNIGGNTIAVKDFNINVGGTIKLDAGNMSRNLDMNMLLNDHQFVNSLKELIKNSINSDMNGGRIMNDLATMRGQISPSSLIGR